MLKVIKFHVACCKTRAGAQPAEREAAPQTMRWEVSPPLFSLEIGREVLECLRWVTGFLLSDTRQAELPLVNQTSVFPPVRWKFKDAAREQHLPWVGIAACDMQQEKVRAVAYRDSPAAGRILQDVCQHEQTDHGAFSCSYFV